MYFNAFIVVLFCYICIKLLMTAKEINITIVDLWDVVKKKWTVVLERVRVLREDVVYLSYYSLVLLLRKVL